MYLPQRELLLSAQTPWFALVPAGHPFGPCLCLVLAWDLSQTADLWREIIWELQNIVLFLLSTWPWDGKFHSVINTLLRSQLQTFINYCIDWLCTKSLSGHLIPLSRQHIIQFLNCTVSLHQLVGLFPADGDVRREGLAYSGGQWGSDQRAGRGGRQGEVPGAPEGREPGGDGRARRGDAQGASTNTTATTPLPSLLAFAPFGHLWSKIVKQNKYTAYWQSE